MVRYRLSSAGFRLRAHVKQNPKSSLVGIGLVAASAPILAPAAVVGGLGIMGFSAAGPVAGMAQRMLIVFK